MEEECEAIAMTTKSPENNLELAVLDSVVKHGVHVKVPLPECALCVYVHPTHSTSCRLGQSVNLSLHRYKKYYFHIPNSIKSQFMLTTSYSVIYCTRVMPSCVPCRVLNVQCTALLCLQNLLTFLDTPNWGGAHKLEEMFTSLFISLNQKSQ